MGKISRNDKKYFFNIPAMEFKQKKVGIRGKIITGEKMQLCYICLSPGVTTYHSHPHEQMGYILSGKVELTIDDEKKICGPGEAYYIPSNIRHGFKVLPKGDLEYIEIFSPPKEENINL